MVGLRHTRKKETNKESGTHERQILMMVIAFIITHSRLVLLIGSMCSNPPSLDFTYRFD